MKKVLALIVTMVLLLAVLPLGAAAENETYVAVVGEDKYTTLLEAVEKAPNNAQIKMLANHTINVDDGVGLSGKYTTLINVSGKTLTIDLNGKTISCSLDRAVTTSAGLVGLFATENNGHLTLKDSSEGGKGTVKIESNDYGVYGLLVCFDETASLTVEGGNYLLDKATDSLVYTGGNENVIIKGGTFKLDNVGTGKNGSPWIFNAGGQNTAHVMVEGGTFNADINHQYYPFEVEMSETLALKKNSNGTWTVVPSVAYVNEQEKSGNWYTRPVGYATLEEAIAAVDTQSASSTDEEVFVTEPIYITGDVVIPEGVKVNLVEEGANLYVLGSLTNNGVIDTTSELKGKVGVSTVTEITVGENKTTKTVGTFSGNAPTDNVGEADPSYTLDGENIYPDDTNGTAVATAMKDGKAVGVYTSLQAACDAQCDEVVLLESITEAGLVINKDLTLDLGGKTYTLDAQNVAVEIKEGNTVQIKNGTIAAGQNVKTLVKNSGDLTLTDVTLDGTGSSALETALSCAAGTVKIKKGTSIKAEDAVAVSAAGGSVNISTAEAVVGDITASGEGAIVLSGGKYSVDVSEYCAAGCHVLNDNGTYTVGKHTLKKTDKVEAECLTGGNSAYWTCEDCGRFYSDKDGEDEIRQGEWVVGPLGHKEKKIPAVAATCEKSGLTEGAECERCRIELKAQKTVDALGHKVEKVPAVAPTCTKTGLTEGKACSRCDKVYVAQSKIAALGHSEDMIPAVPATCEETGLTEGTKCWDCGAILVAQKTVEALGHTEAPIPAVEPLCEKVGLTEGKQCSECGKVLEEQQTVPAAGHKYIAHEAQDPTCTQIGWDDYETCEECGHTTYQEKPALGHEETVIPAVGATYSEAGSTEGSQCSVCDEILVEPQQIPAKPIWIWIVLGAVVLIAAGACILFIPRKNKNKRRR